MKKLLVALLVIILGVGGGIGLFALSVYLGTDITQSDNNNAVNKNDDDDEKVNGTNMGTDYKPNRNVTNYIFVGDSRYVAMENLATDTDTFICKEGEGLSFLQSHIYDIKSNIVDKDTVIIIGMGVNDYKYSFDDYVSTINQLDEEIDCQLCYMLVNPVDDEKIQNSGYQITNEELDEFNNNMKLALNSDIMIIDTNSYLKENGYNTVDGLHYDEVTYENIYWYIKSYVNNN